MQCTGKYPFFLDMVDVALMNPQVWVSFEGSDRSITLLQIRCSKIFSSSCTTLMRSNYSPYLAKKIQGKFKVYGCHISLQIMVVTQAKLVEVVSAPGKAALMEMTFAGERINIDS
ncbi:unnamed protein product [Heligmosomoides polygyrus]|uniref:Gag-pol polyprotein n=1 Tax=Heligmosomoides polygyrus TaxID=6339 RepID=A0A183GF25_HELPZ|nr:unnamed protein product [Heligmosomoides polygyrus]